MKKFNEGTKLFDILKYYRVIYQFFLEINLLDVLKKLKTNLSIYFY